MKEPRRPVEPCCPAPPEKTVVKTRYHYLEEIEKRFPRGSGPYMDVSIDCDGFNDVALNHSTLVLIHGEVEEFLRSNPDVRRETVKLVLAWRHPHVRYQTIEPNPHYEEALATYDIALRIYQIDMEAYTTRFEEYQREMSIYQKWCIERDLHAARGEVERLEARLKDEHTCTAKPVG